jgi:hypothetical protein
MKFTWDAFEFQEFDIKFGFSLTITVHSTCLVTRVLHKLLVP